MHELPELTRTEDWAVRLARFANESPAAKRVMMMWLHSAVRPFVHATVARRMFVDGLDRAMALTPDRGLVLASNHRTFFDMWLGMLPLFANHCQWSREVFFPVRSTFFYERPAGMLLTYSIGGGALYPPIFRDRAKAAYNEDALDRMARFLQRRGVVVGIHPEGTRGKGPDPYQLLPAQPGVGNVVLHAQPTVLPMFVHGLTNDFLSDVKKNYTRDPRKEPVVLVYGEPFDYSEFLHKKPRLALYKKLADKLHGVIRQLGEREQLLREQILAGELDDSPCWFVR